MYESIYKFAKARNLSATRKNRSWKFVSCHICVDELGHYENVVFHDRKNDGQTLCPDIGSLGFGDKASPICEKLGYIFSGADGVDVKSKTVKKHENWLSIMEDGAFYDKDIEAVCLLLREMESDKVLKNRIYSDCKKGGVKDDAIVSFSVNNRFLEKQEGWAEWMDLWVSANTKSEKTNTRHAISCITGEKILPLIQDNFEMIKTSQTGTGSYLCSFGDENSAFRHYGFEGNLGTPMSAVEGTVVKAGIEYLLKSESNHNDLFGIVYWFEQQENDILGKVINLNAPKKQKKKEGAPLKTEDEFTRELEHFLNSEKTITQSRRKNDIFHIARYQVPSKGRFRLLNDEKIKRETLVANIQQWYEDTNLKHAVFEESKDGYTFKGNFDLSLCNIYLILYGLLKNKKAKNAFQQAEKEFGDNRYALLKSMLFNQQLPDIFFNRAIDEMTHIILTNEGSGLVPMQVIKCYLNRTGRKEYQMTESLNETSKAPGYLLGRWLALVGKLQEDSAYPQKINCPITVKYYKSMKYRPASVFSAVNDNINTYFEKLRKTGRTTKYIFFTRELGSLAMQISEIGIPGKMNNLERGCFDLGFAQQSMELRTRSREPIEAPNKGLTQAKLDNNEEGDNNNG